MREQRQGDREIKNLNINTSSAVFCRGVCVENVAFGVKQFAALKLPLHIFCLASARQTVPPHFLSPLPKNTNYSGPGLNVSCLKVEKVTDE